MNEPSKKNLDPFPSQEGDLHKPENAKPQLYIVPNEIGGESPMGDLNSRPRGEPANFLPRSMAFLIDSFVVGCLSLPLIWLNISLLVWIFKIDLKALLESGTIDPTHPFSITSNITNLMIPLIIN